MSLDDFIDKAKKIHGEKYDYSKVIYAGYQKKVIITCPIHGDFLKTPSNHLKGQGCPHCACEQATSKGEEEIAEYVKNIVGEENMVRNSRSIIPPKELDIYIPSLRIAIEYHGLFWHSESQGKDKYYHLNKLNACNEKGIKLLQIFEDEWLEKKDIVKTKIRHLLKLNDGLIKIPARKCTIKEIKKEEAAEFLNIFHIQGTCPCTVALGCFDAANNLIAVMTFKKDHKDGDTWELTRFASSWSVVCQGCGGKLFKYFLRAYSPSEVKSFADRRWTASKEDNLYTKLGFVLQQILKPDYNYIVGLTRKHKFGFRKQHLHQKYNLPLDMTEKEMTNELGLQRIWNCGLLKYVWKKE